ncbi:hypothetical protein B9Z55_019030 [Caenorhabditis nigoni]|nr:hypothetical protein B9Z55_019030 [Caenorhabditis nigoni]
MFLPSFLDTFSWVNDLIAVDEKNRPELVNNRPPTVPGYRKREIYVAQKRVKFDRLIQDKLQWLQKGNHHTSHYILKGDYFQFTKNKSEATHLLRQSDYTFPGWSGLDKTVLRMLLIDENTNTVSTR